QAARVAHRLAADANVEEGRIGQAAERQRGGAAEQVTDVAIARRERQLLRPGGQAVAVDDAQLDGHVAVEPGAVAIEQSRLPLELDVLRLGQRGEEKQGQRGEDAHEETPRCGTMPRWYAWVASWASGRRHLGESF